MATSSNPVACTLRPAEVGDRLTEWSKIQRIVISAEEVANGVRLRLPADRVRELEDLADRESKCCSFLQISVAGSVDYVEMEITSANPDGVPVARLLAGLEDR